MSVIETSSALLISEPSAGERFAQQMA